MALIHAARSALAKARKLFSVELHWIRGHANVGGNERVDRLAKHFARACKDDCGAAIIPDAFAVSHASSSQPWPHGFPLSSVDPAAFTVGLPFSNSRSVLPFLAASFDSSLTPGAR